VFAGIRWWGVGETPGTENYLPVYLGGGLQFAAAAVISGELHLSHAATLCAPGRTHRLMRGPSRSRRASLARFRPARVQARLHRPADRVALALPERSSSQLGAQR